MVSETILPQMIDRMRGLGVRLREGFTRDGSILLMYQTMTLSLGITRGITRECDDRRFWLRIGEVKEWL